MSFRKLGFRLPNDSVLRCARRQKDWRVYLTDITRAVMAHKLQSIAPESQLPHPSSGSWQRIILVVVSSDSKAHLHTGLAWESNFTVMKFKFKAGIRGFHFSLPLCGEFCCAQRNQTASEPIPTTDEIIPTCRQISQKGSSIWGTFSSKQVQTHSKFCSPEGISNLIINNECSRI